MVNCHKTKDVREMRIFHESREITPSELFGGMYSHLDSLIRFNQEHSGAYVSGNDSYKTTSRERHRDALYEKARNGVESVSGQYHVEMVFDDLDKKNLGVFPRTNYEDSTLKEPNIVFLAGNGAKIILREARTYENPFFDRRLRNKFGNKYKGKIPREDLAPKDVEDRGLLFVPEPHLLLSLEDLVSDGRIARITPKFKVVRVDEKNLWYLRDFLPSLRDIPLSIGRIGEYLGTFNALGLIDTVDGQPAHYCLAEKGKAVNVDPDFIIFTKSGSIVQNTDWPDFKKRSGELFVTGDDLNKIQKIRAKVLEGVSTQVGNDGLLPYLNDSFDSYNSLRQNVVENFGEPIPN